MKERITEKITKYQSQGTNMY